MYRRYPVRRQAAPRGAKRHQRTRGYPKMIYDIGPDAGYIYFKPIKAGEVKRTIKAHDGSIMLDFDEQGRLIGIEVLNAKAMTPAGFFV